MRPQHQNQNRRMRGGRSPRKSTNPLSRTYESNGPDVKVRGNAQHVAEKYVQLARDANASGDPVLAESYLQHAEHYCRLLVAAHTQTHGQSHGGAGNNPRGDDTSPDLDDYDELDGEPDRFTFVAPSSGRTQVVEDAPIGTGAQPVYERSQNGESSSSGERTHQNGERNNQERHNQERQPRYNNGENGGGQQNSNNSRFGRRDRFGRRERYQGGQESEQSQNGNAQPRDGQPREAHPRETRDNREHRPRNDAARESTARNDIARHDAPQPEVNYDIVTDHVATNGQNDTQQRDFGRDSAREGGRDSGRRDRFGRNRFERPQRSNHENGQPLENNASERQSINHERVHEGSSEANRGSSTLEKFATPEKVAAPEKSERTAQPEKVTFHSEDGLPAFLKQPTRITAPEAAIADDVSDAPVKRGRGRPRKAAAEDVAE